MSSNESNNPTKIFVILSVCTIAIIFAAGVLAATVSPSDVEQPRIEQKS